MEFASQIKAPAATADDRQPTLGQVKDLQTRVGAANPQTGTSYTLALADAGRPVETNNSAPNTVIVPTDASVPIPLESVIEIGQYGVGQTTITAAVGVTIRSAGGRLKLTGQYSVAALRKRAANEWWLVGDLTA